MGAQVITTIVEAAGSYDLTDLATVKTELNISSGDTSNDAWLNLKIAQVSQMVQTYCNRPFVSETYQDQIFPDRGIEPFWSIGRFNVLQLARWPVSEITSVVLQVDANSADNVTLVSGTDFLLNGDPGQIVRLNSLTGLPTKWQPLPATVVYQGGYTDIPTDLIGAVLEMIASRYQSRGRDPFTKRTNQPGGIGEIEYWVPNNPQGAFPPSVVDVIDKYRVPVNA